MRHRVCYAPLFQRVFVLLCLTGGLAGSQVRSQTVDAAAEIQYSTPAFSEYFDGSTANQWRFDYRQNNGSWYVSDGRLYGYGSCGAFWANLNLYDQRLYFQWAPDDFYKQLQVWLRFSEHGYYRVDLELEYSEIAIDIFKVSPPYSQPSLLGMGSLPFYEDEVLPISITISDGYIEVSDTTRTAYLLSRNFSLLAIGGAGGETHYGGVNASDAYPLPEGVIVFFGLPDWSGWIDNLEIDAPTPTPPQCTRWINGRVMANRGSILIPLSGVRVTAYGSNDPDIPYLANLGSGYSDSEGNFGIMVEDGFAYYTIEEDYIEGASPDFILCDTCMPWTNSQARFQAPLWEHNLYLEFINWMTAPVDTSTPTATQRPTSTPTVTRTLTQRPSVTPTITLTSTRKPSQTPTYTTRPSATPTHYIEPEPPELEDGNLDTIIGILGGGAALGGGGWLLRRWLGSRKHPAIKLQPGTPQPPSPKEPPQTPVQPEPGQGQPQEPQRPPFVPLFPHVRLLKVWVSEGPERGGRLLRDRSPLRVGKTYSLHVQVQPGGGQNPAGMPPGEGMAKQSTAFNLAFFAPEGEINIDNEAATLHLPARGASNIIRRAFTPLQAGQASLRVGLFYGNLLVQSSVLEAVVAPQRARTGQVANQRVVDYVASADLSDLAFLPQPSVSIFINQAANGSHWLGVYEAQGKPGMPMVSGRMQEFNESEIKSRAKEMRELLAVVQGGRAYPFQSSLRLSLEQVQRLEQFLVRLALTGWQAYHSLFLARCSQVDYARLPSTEKPGLISIARCRGNSPTLPWAAMYDLWLETSLPQAVRLCPVFKNQLISNDLSPEVDAPAKPHRDLLDNLRTCRGQAACPMKGTQAHLTVCPFGFWGFIHEIEQPLQSVTPTPVDQTPPELTQPETARRLRQCARIVHVKGKALDVAAAVYNGIPDASEHMVELRQAAEPGVIDLHLSNDRNQVLQSFIRGQYEVYYFYCHGVIRDNEFRLMLGQAGQPAYIGASDIDPRQVRWPEEMAPFVVLNGCETMRLTPELIHGFLGLLRQMGASGVVGSEMPVNSLLARQVGRMLLQRMLKGYSIGEAFLTIRRDLLRQGNPLGLAYSYYASAALHLHDPANCAWCKMRLGL